MATRVEHLKQVLQVLQQNKLKLNQKKCSFGQPRLEYLSHIILKDGVATDPKNIEVIWNWPVSQRCKGFEGILGIDQVS